MKRTLKYALSAVLTAAIVLPAVAQDNFPDVPDNHWAFEALQRMKKDGLLVGYPDGLFRGGRPASRYELAVAMHAVYTNLKSVTDGLDSQIKALSDKLNGVASTADIQNLRDALTALQNSVEGMKSYGDDIANLKKMGDTFQKELQSLGVDVEAMKKDLGDISARLTKVEHMKPAVNIGGEVNLLLLAGNSRDGRFGLDTDGKINGVNPATLAPSGITKDAVMLQEGAFTFSGTNDTGPKWKGTLVVGNMLDTIAGQSQIHPGTPYLQGASDVYLQDFSVKFDTSIAGLAFNAELGRVGYKVSPYMYQRIDNTSYFANERWDDGLYRFDGGILGFNFGSAKLDVFAGNNRNVNSVNGMGINPIQAGPVNGAFGGIGPMVIDQTLGANLNLPLTANGNLNLAYLWLDSDAGLGIGPATPNRLAVYGGDVKFNFGKLGVSGGYSKSDLQDNTTNVNNQDNSEWHVHGKYDGGRWGIHGGYREVEANYLAPGDWGQLGVMRNPTNIKGFNVGGHFDLSDAITLNAWGEFDKGKSNTFGATTGFDTNTDINSWSVGLTYHMNSNLSIMLGYENTEFKKLDPAVVATSLNGDSTYRWTTFGVGYGLSDSAKLMLQYQISDITNDFQVIKGGGGRFTGGLLSGQLSIKF
jgi:PAS domain-containing protein